MSFGFNKIGLSPYGFATPKKAPEIKGELKSTRFINSLTGDYEIDSNTKRLKSMDPISQKVQLALLTNLKSIPTLRDFGNNVGNIKKLDNTTQSKVESAVRNALNDMIEREEIQLLSVTSKNNGFNLSYSVRFKNLLSEEIEDIVV